MENKNSLTVMRAQKRKKQNAVEYFGGKCQICSYFKCIEALEFHHLEKSEKEESPSYVILRWSWKKAKKELEKCILLCCRCHREIHAEEKNGTNFDLQNFIKPWIKFSCPTCQNDFETKNEEQKFCSQICYKFFSRKVTRPTKEELENLIKEKISWIKLGQMFGVSDNSIRKWAKGYGLL